MRLIDYMLSIVVGFAVLSGAILMIGYAVDFYHNYYSNLELTRRDVEWAESRESFKRSNERHKARMAEFELLQKNWDYDREMGR